MCSDVFVNKAKSYQRDQLYLSCTGLLCLRVFIYTKVLATCSYHHIYPFREASSPKQNVHSFLFFLLTYRYNLEILKTIYT